MKHFVNAMGNALVTILVILLIGYGWAFFEMKIMLKATPELFGYAFYQQKDVYMYPDFNIDDIIIVKKDVKFKNGDKVLYLNENSEFVIENIEYTDSVSSNVICNTCSGSKTIDNSTILGVAVGKISSFGKFINFFKQKWFLVTLAILGFGAIIASQYMVYKPNVKQEKKTI